MHRETGQCRWRLGRGPAHGGRSGTSTWADRSQDEDEITKTKSEQQADDTKIKSEQQDDDAIGKSGFWFWLSCPHLVLILPQPDGKPKARGQAPGRGDEALGEAPGRGLTTHALEIANAETRRRPCKQCWCFADPFIAASRVE